MEPGRGKVMTSSCITKHSEWYNELLAYKVALKQPDMPHCAVLYTDGGCRPSSRGVGGWGLHGYFYIDVKPKQGHGCKGFIPTKDGYVNITPGGNKDNEVTVLEYIDGEGPILPASTNNEAEVVALTRALELILVTKPQAVLIKMDSEYALRGVTEWLPQWSKTQWSKNGGGPIANAERWMRVLALLQEIGDTTQITYTWVQAHADSVGNNQADFNATCGVFAGFNKQDVDEIIRRPIKDYWAPDIDRNRFLSEPSWYFVTGAQSLPHKERYFYHLGNHGPDDDAIGQPISDSTLAVVALKEQEPVLKKLLDHQTTIADGFGGVLVVARLDNVFKPRVYRHLAEKGTSYLFKPSYKADLVNASKLLITREKNPPLMAFQAINKLSELQAVVEDILDGKTGVDSSQKIMLTDITDLIYEETQVKNATVLKVKLENGAENLVLKPKVDYVSGADVKSTQITLSIGQDAPRRNFFAGVASSKPRVFVVTWPEPDSSVAFRYGTFVTTEKDCGIWAGAYSNLWIVTH